VRELAAGVWTISTASHGGIHLSDDRNRAVPAELRAAAGWYEEDIQWAIVALVHSEAFTDGEREIARNALRNSQPVAFTQLTGEAVLPGQSHALDRANFYAEHPDAWIVTSAMGDWADWVEPKMVGVFARQGEPGSKRYHAIERCFLVSPADYDRRTDSPVGYVIDPQRDREVSPPSDPLARRR
jgi:hypothetical protein